MINHKELAWAMQNNIVSIMGGLQQGEAANTKGKKGVLWGFFCTEIDKEQLHHRRKGRRRLRLNEGMWVFKVCIELQHLFHNR